MRKNQDGFGIVELLIILVAISVLGFVGWFVAHRNSDSLSLRPISKSKQITITLTDKGSNKAISNTAVKVHSNNGKRCIQAPCPINEKSWNGSTNDKGVITLPKDVIQYSTSITPAGYTIEDLPYDASKTSYEMAF